MCQKCQPDQGEHDASVPRRNFLKLAGAAAAGLLISGKVATAAGAAALPRPQNAISPDAALERLLKGNARYASGNMHKHDFIAERPALVAGQNPFAGILSCADSRIAPEYAFDAGRGDVFVCRVAGNFADSDSIASFEYGVAVLGLPLIVVLGHQSCGAVEAAIKAVKDGATFPGHIPSLLRNLRPAVKAVLDQPGDMLANATKENVRLTVEHLKTAGPILNKGVENKTLKIVGGIYDLTTGKVDIFA